jgi:hypothetical protein
MKNSRNGTLLLVPAILAMGIMTMLADSSAAAVDACGAVDQSRFVGVQYWPGGYAVRGAKATVDIQNADLCTTYVNGTSTWAMVNATELTGWAQIGYINRASEPTPTYFWQWMKDSSAANPNWATGVFGSPSIGATPTFKVERTGSNGHLFMYLNDDVACVDSECAETPFDPLVAWDGTAAEWYGETHRVGSDVPGTNDDRVNFDNVRVKNTSANWVSEVWTATGGDRCFYNLALVDTSSHFKIWTQPLDHSC